MKNLLLSICIFTIAGTTLNAQLDSTLFTRIPIDTMEPALNMDATYDRPFLKAGKLPVSLGGYAEANWQHLSTDGVSEGHQFQFRRMTLFVASTIIQRIKFLSEIELEEGGKEIAIEFASVDVELDPLLNLRGGIVMNPIGSFNQNHDGPKWEFTDRPISSTQMLPATWSNAGFGVFGKLYKNKWMFGYEIYLTGGFNNSIIDNEENKTFLPAAKENDERFESSASGTPLVTTKVAIRNDHFGEIGFSFMGGIYNQFQDDGVVIDDKRRCDVVAIDYTNTIAATKTTIIGEWAWVFVEVPDSYTQQYGSKQHGGFVDIVQPILDRKMFGWDDAVLNLALRLEYVDWNVGTFEETGDPIGDQLWSLMPALSFRPGPQTVFRLNYRHLLQEDLFGNTPARTGGFSFGISTYF